MRHTLKLPTQWRKRLRPCREPALYTLWGLLSALFVFEGRAPLAIALLSACTGRDRALFALAGAAAAAPTYAAKSLRSGEETSLQTGAGCAIIGSTYPLRGADRPCMEGQEREGAER